MPLKKFTVTAAPYTLKFGDVSIDGYAYNGSVPAPEIRVNIGDDVEITLINNLEEDTTLHLHGIHTAQGMDGIPTQQASVAPGDSFVYQFTADHAGTFMMHPHISEAVQTAAGLYGVIVVEDPEESNLFDVDMSIMLSAHQSFIEKGMKGMAPMNEDIFAINGRIYPDTEQLIIKKGDMVRMRLCNLSNYNHPMHLHGHDMFQIMQDGHSIPSMPFNTIDIAPGQTKDIIFEANNPGSWLFHCHELHHAEGGMVMDIFYEGFEQKSTKKGGMGGLKMEG